MNWIHRILLADVMEETVYAQDRAIDLLLVEREHMLLEHTRFIRSMVEQFLIVQESGVDVRDTLIEGLRDMDDEIARREEHLV